MGSEKKNNLIPSNRLISDYNNHNSRQIMLILVKIKNFKKRIKNVDALIYEFKFYCICSFCSNLK